MFVAVNILILFITTDFFLYILHCTVFFMWLSVFFRVDFFELHILANICIRLLPLTSADTTTVRVVWSSFTDWTSLCVIN